MKKLKKWIIRIVVILVTLFVCLVLVLYNMVAVVGMYHKVKYGLFGHPDTDVLCIGSSSMFFWSTFEQDLEPNSAVNVGIPGAVIGDWIPEVDSLVVPFKPEIILIYLGANDLHKDNPDVVLSLKEMETLVTLLHEKVPGAKLYALTVYSTTAASDHFKDDDQFNSGLKSLAEKYSYLEIIDVASALRDSPTKPKEGIFKSDNVHLNSAGYKIWSAEVRSVLYGE
ncbi:MAG: GDSL-type esterase/lipase family protein [Erysipelotrichaceae bacterium]|jgi:lysophospholipase L1-like esterase|nr:GDSL-type esterase/lipase family protein [Erysipelotrichaceae bacterium]